MTTINPAFMCGPPLVLPFSPEKINETMRAVWTILSGRPIPQSLGGSGAFVDVRDLAALIVAAVEKNVETNGERCIACGGSGGEQAIAGILWEAYPNRRDVLDRGEPGKGYMKGFGFKDGGSRVDTRKGEGLLGRGGTGYERSVSDAAKAFEVYL